MEAFYLTPAISFHRGECECCGESAGFAVCVHFLFWGINFVFAGDIHL